MTFANKIVLVAGGTGGLGRAVTLAFLDAGAEVIVSYRADPEFTETNSLAGVRASRLTGRKLDVTNEGAVEQLLAGILSSHGRLDVLVNTVGGYAGGPKLWESDSATLDRMLALNLGAGFFLASAAAKAMLPRASGAIVNVAAKAALDHPAGLGADAAAKGDV